MRRGRRRLPAARSSTINWFGIWRQPLAQVVVLEGSQAPRQQQMVNMLLGERAEQGAAGQEQEEGESAGSKQ